MTPSQTILHTVLHNIPGGDSLLSYARRVRDHKKTIAEYEAKISDVKSRLGIEYTPVGGRWPFPAPVPRDFHFDVRFSDGEMHKIHLTEERGYEDLDGMAHIQHYKNVLQETHIRFGTPVAPDFRVLDCACGSGYGSNYLQQELRCHVSGVDIAEKTVLYAAKRYAVENPRLRYLHDDAEVLRNFDSQSLDVISSIETIEHVPHPDKVLATYRRVLKPGGFLYITSPDATDRPGTLSTAFHVQEWTEADFGTLLGMYFEEIQIFRRGYYLVAHCRMPLQQKN